MVYLRDPGSRQKRTMPLLTGESGESGESGDATPKLGDEAHPRSPIGHKPSPRHLAQATTSNLTPEPS